MKALHFLLLCLQVWVMPAALALCSEHIRLSKPADIYVVKSDGTVIDTRTGLMWLACSHGQAYSNGTCTGTPAELTWGEAMQKVGSLNKAKYLGYADWRVPNKNELGSLVETACITPALNAAVFPGMPYENFLYWTSSPYIGIEGYAWAVEFDYGSSDQYFIFNYFHVRFVRGG